MSPTFGDDLVYPNLASCKMRLVGSGNNVRPPVQLPKELREAAFNLSSNGAEAFLVGFALERAVLKRQEERNRDRSLKQATSREELEAATIAKMKTVTGADEAICIAMLRDHGYDFEESIEAYLAKM